ncbi:hypothetical protein [Saccharospirillum impatiens]|uniref:hypothetical protein n=1 Tax=Saccharospirillum impatiens TaxID=169438 RepID=UPI000491F7AC|nr:hypothetical protein [Saccharospirillum impatiens]
MFIIIGSALSMVLTLALMYFMFMQNSPPVILDLGFVNYLIKNAGAAIGGLIGMLALSFFAILPMLASIPATFKEMMSQRRLSRQPIQVTGKVVTATTEGLNHTLIRVSYAGQTNAFQVDNRVLMSAVERGTELTVFYDPKNKSNAYIDFIGSLEEDRSRIVQSGTVIKILEITPKFTVTPDSFEILGELHGGSFTAQKVSMVFELQREDLSRYSPGAILPCEVSGSTDNYSISILSS